MITKPTENHRYFKQKRVFNEQHQEDDIVTIYSQRAGIIALESLNTVTVSQVYCEINQRDDFGLVVVYISDSPFHIRIQAYTNGKYEIIVWNMARFIHKTITDGYTKLNTIFD